MKKYIKHIWEDRIVQYPNRYKDQNGNILILIQEPGEVAKIGSLVDAEKMNNIENGIYDTTEELINLKYNLETDGPAVKTGRTVDGKEEWVKRINFGALPNAGIKAVSIGVDLSKIIMNRVDFIPRNIEGDSNLVPFVSTTTLGYQISAYFRANGANNVQNAFAIDTGTLDRSSFSCYVEIYFTCIGNYDPNEEVS